MAPLALLALAACTAPVPDDPTPPVDSVHAVIDLSDQQIVVTHTRVVAKTSETYRWPVSTGRPGFETPLGSYRPFFLSRDHRSSLYEDAPMPWSVFFAGDVAVHGTLEQRSLGRPVSHGCVRVHPTYAKLFFRMVQEVGKAQTTITVQP